MFDGFYSIWLVIRAAGKKVPGKIAKEQLAFSIQPAWHFGLKGDFVLGMVTEMGYRSYTSTVAADAAFQNCLSRFGEEGPLLASVSKLPKLKDTARKEIQKVKGLRVFAMPKTQLSFSPKCLRAEC